MPILFNRYTVVLVATFFLSPGPSAAHADELRIPNCEQFIEYGASGSWTAPQTTRKYFGKQAQALTTADLDHIIQACERCLEARPREHTIKTARDILASMRQLKAQQTEK